MSSFFKPAEPSPEPEVTNTHCMVDLETMGTKPGAPILSIGAVLFDPRQTDSVQAMRQRGFLRRIDVADAVKHSHGVEPETLKWWLGQDDAAIKSLVADGAVPLHQALKEFRQYCADRFPKSNELFFQGHSSYPRACILWANSPDFDCKMLELACERVDERLPFLFRDYRCLRTLKDLAWPDAGDRPKFAAGTAHDALDDAISQALAVQAGFAALGLGLSDAVMETF